MNMSRGKVATPKPSKYAGAIEDDVGRLEGLQKLVKPTGSIRTMLETLFPHIDDISKLNGQDKVVLKGILRSICPSYPHPVAVERDDLVSIYEGADPSEAMALLLGVLVTVDQLTNKAASFMPERMYDWYRGHKQLLIADWWRQILADMLFLRPTIFDEDHDEILSRLQMLDPIPLDRLVSAKTKQRCRRNRQSSGPPPQSRQSHQEVRHGSACDDVHGQ